MFDQSSWYSEVLLLWSLLTFVTGMLNAVVFSVVGNNTAQILYHNGLCAVRELIRMSMKLLFLSTKTEGKRLFICDWFSLAAFLFRK